MLNLTADICIGNQTQVMLSPPPTAAIMARRGVKGLPLLHLNMASHALAKKKKKYTVGQVEDLAGEEGQFLRAHSGVTLLIGTYLESKVKCIIGVGRN